MDPHHQQQQNRRRAVDAGGGSGQAHPPPQPCPRCNSNNTKFCYYNNYSLSQPRYFCKGCRRYWTQGGTLRNVPVGGGCRKSNKRPKLEGSAGASSQSQSPQLPLTLPVPPPSQLPHQQLISIMANNNNNNNNSSNNNISTNNNISNNNNNIGYFGETPGLFLSSLGVNRPMSFGPNLGLLHGFGIPNFDHQQPVQQQQHNQEVSLPSLYSTRELGSSSTSSIQEWNLRMGPGPGPSPGLGSGPVVPQGNVNTHANDNDHNHNNRDQERNDNIRSSNEPWSNFLGTSGLHDP